MKRIVALGLALGLVAACSEPPPPPPKPVAKAVEIPKPEPKPEAVKPEPPKPDPNKELAAKVKDALEAPDSKLPSGAIDVTAAEGKVTLWGALPTQGAVRRAAQLAGQVQGVKRDRKSVV